MRYTRIITGLACVFAASTALAADGQVWKNPSCGCCKAWIAHMATNGFTLDVKEMDQTALADLKRGTGISEAHASCHTAKIAGYAIEGHVPAASIKRLLAEKPDAIGLAVPGMPAGSPGMETDGPSETYDVLLIKKDGSTEIFQHVEP